MAWRYEIFLYQKITKVKVNVSGVLKKHCVGVMEPARKIELKKIA
jgi:hypothetical protein